MFEYGRPGRTKTFRHAIEIGFLKGDLEEIEKIFHCSSYSDKGAPTNSSPCGGLLLYGE